MIRERNHKWRLHCVRLWNGKRFEQMTWSNVDPYSIIFDDYKNMCTLKQNIEWTAVTLSLTARPKHCRRLYLPRLLPFLKDVHLSHFVPDMCTLQAVSSRAHSWAVGKLLHTVSLLRHWLWSLHTMFPRCVHVVGCGCSHPFFTAV